MEFHNNIYRIIREVSIMSFLQNCERFFSSLIAIVFVIFISKPILAQEKNSPQSLTKIERGEIESIVKDFILNNPEHIIKAIQSLQQREKIKKYDKIKGNLINYHNVLMNDPDTPVGGNQKGSVNVVEFFDYRCGYCKRVLPDIIKLISSDKNIRFIFKELPILGPQSITASKAGLAAWILDEAKYQTFHKAMMKAKGGLSDSRIMKLAANSGYNINELQKTMKTPRIDTILEKNYNLAKALEINGTPAFIIGDQVIRGAVDLKTLKSLILEAKGS
jgi:protein-disulfide isomerase